MSLSSLMARVWVWVFFDNENWIESAVDLIDAQYGTKIIEVLNTIELFWDLESIKSIFGKKTADPLSNMASQNWLAWKLLLTSAGSSWTCRTYAGFVELLVLVDFVQNPLNGPNSISSGAPCSWTLLDADEAWANGRGALGAPSAVPRGYGWVSNYCYRK